MKRILSLMISMVLLTAPALAEEQKLTNCAVANGNAAAVRYVDVVAPYSGTLEAFALETGDVVEAGEGLFRMMTTTVYATEDGKVNTVFACKGDDAQAVMERYGGLAAVEPASRQRIAASLKHGYSSTETRTICVGDQVYFRSSRSGKEVGEGVVVMINGTDFVVDVLKGEFMPTETLKLFQDDDYATDDHVGTGDVLLRDPLLPAGQGRVYEVLAKEGAAVRNGDALFTLLSADAAPDASPDIAAPSAGVVGQISVAPGQQVYKGQVLARIHLTDQMEIVAEVDEVDLNGLRVGDSVYVVMDMDTNRVLTGTVTEISQYGESRQNAAYYSVHVSVPEKGLLLGASASVYIPAE